MGGWSEENNTIIKEFKFDDFRSAMNFVNKVAQLAEATNHHPDILIFSYKFVRLCLTTHDKGAVTKKDRDMAKIIDALV